MGNPLLTLDRFRTFANNFQQQFGNANPQQIVQNLLNSGQMTQAQYENLRKQANKILGTQY